MTEQQKVNANSNWSIKILRVLVILIIAGALAFGGYSSFVFITDKISASEIKAEKSFIEAKHLQMKLEQLQNVVQVLQSEVQKSNINKAKQWKPTVIEHLIRMADLTLNTTEETKLAISFLSTAREYASGQELLAINHALNKDIANLQVVPVIDPSVLILKIEALSQKIDSLQAVTRQLASAEKSKLDESSAKTLWRRFFVSTVNALKDIVIIRYQNVEPLLLPEQATILRLNVQTKLLQAELAVMHRQNKLYQSSLEDTINLITRYFASSSIATADILPALKELQLVDLQPKLPSLTGSVAAILDFMNSNQEQNEQSQKPQAPQSEGVR